MNNLVVMQDQQAVTSSVNVSERFGKEHRNIIRNIEDLKKDVLNFEQMFFETTEPDSYGRDRKVYLMNRDGFTLLAMGFTGKKALQFKLAYIDAFNRMEDAIKLNYPRHQLEAFEKQLIGAEYAARILKVDEASKVRMIAAAHQQHGVPTNHLPAYVDEELKKSITVLLKEHDVGFGAAKANNILIRLGLLEIKERPSAHGGTKEFKSLTDAGLKYGANAISPQNPKETQPLYYPSKFADLAEMLKREAAV